jgi:hypothetical protein
MRCILLRLLGSFRSSRAERELAREIQAHLQLLEDRFLANGMGPEEARHAARRAFGGVEQVKAHHREARMFRWAGRLAHGPEARRTDARQVSRPDDRR